MYVCIYIALIWLTLTGPSHINVPTIYELSVYIFYINIFITFLTDNSNTTTIAIGVVVAIIGVLINIIVIVVIILVVRRRRNNDIKTIDINAAEIPVQGRYGVFYLCKKRTYLAFKCTTI